MKSVQKGTKKAAGKKSRLLLSPVRSASVETLVEALDTAAGIDQLLLAREERVALGADFNLDVLFGGEHLDDVAAVAGDRGFLAIRMDAFLCHGFHLFQRFGRVKSDITAHPDTVRTVVLWIKRRIYYIIFRQKNQAAFSLNCCPVYGDFA